MQLAMTIVALTTILLLGGCSSTRFDPRIGQAPMGATAKEQARAYFGLPNHKAFAFSPEKGTNRHTWGAASAEAAAQNAMRQCEELTRTRCVLFAVDNEIVWGPSGNGAVGAQGTTRVGTYLVGSFDVQGNRRTFLRVVNPTGVSLRLFAAFFDQSGIPMSCHSGMLPADGLMEVDVRRVVGVRTRLGVVKVVALADGGARPNAGLAGSTRTTIGGQLVTETWLHPVEAGPSADELSTVGRLCGW